ncbi:kinase-like protein [Panus rudis PR-1116 ss-1]|nr:kinase-like protein [Panus rudis PR-1116 ss-1]
MEVLQPLVEPSQHSDTNAATRFHSLRTRFKGIVGRIRRQGSAATVQSSSYFDYDLEFSPRISQELPLDMQDWVHIPSPPKSPSPRGLEGRTPSEADVRSIRAVFRGRAGHFPQELTESIYVLERPAFNESGDSDPYTNFPVGYDYMTRSIVDFRGVVHPVSTLGQGESSQSVSSLHSLSSGTQLRRDEFAHFAGPWLVHPWSADDHLLRQLLPSTSAPSRASDDLLPSVRSRCTTPWQSSVSELQTTDEPQELQPEVDKSPSEDLIPWLQSILARKDDGDLFRLGVDEAAVMIDVLQEVLWSPSLLGDLFAQPEEVRIGKRRLLDLLKGLSYAYDRLPQCMHLDAVTEVEQDFRVAGGSANIHFGWLEDRPVALKRLRWFQSGGSTEQEKMHKAFIREVLIWGNLSSHPNVLPFIGIDSNTFPHSPCIVLPWMKNGNLLQYAQVVQNREDLPALIMLWLRHIGEGLAFIHHEHVAHGDLRGANVLIDEDETAILTDFGLSRLVGDQLTQNSTVGRKPNWLAPEFLSEEQPESAPRRTYAGDVYAFGCVCIELFTGLPPYHGCYPVRLITRILEGDHPSRPALYDRPQEMSDELWRIIEQCFAYAPAQRPSARWLARALASVEHPCRELL